jgi:predicted nuclease of predicted toxin-antitoxin system
VARKLRLLVDEGVYRPVTDWLKNYGRLRVTDVYELGLQGVEDCELVKKATEERRVLVVIDRGFSQKRYPICTHSGIIRVGIKKPHTSEEMIRVLKSFFQSGEGAQCKHAVVTLRDDSFEIQSQDGLMIHRYD